MALGAGLFIAPGQLLAFSYSTSFELGEGFSLGRIHGQNGYQSYMPGADVEMVSNQNPSSGNQHVRLSGPGLEPDRFVGFTKFFDSGEADIWTFSIDTYFSNQGGAPYFIVLERSALSISAFVRFDPAGNILLRNTLGGGPAIDTGRQWVSGSYQNLTVRIDNVNARTDYFYGGEHIFTGELLDGGAIRSVFVYSLDRYLPGEFADFDNLSITGQPIPEPATMIGLAAGAALLAARRRRTNR